MQGHFELNVYKPVMASNVINSAYLLANSIDRLQAEVVEKLEPNLEKIKQLMENSLMLVTALNPHIGYENSAKIAKHAFKIDSTLKKAAAELGLVKEEDFDGLISPKKMSYPHD